MTITERFLKYVSFCTTSDENTNMTPSTPGQMEFARFLKDELIAIGLQEVELDANGYIMATLPATAEGKPVISVDGKDYLLEKPLKADIAFLRANIVDEDGNMVFLGTTQNFNPLMAMAADYVIVEAEKLVKRGEIAPEMVHASGIFVDAIYVEK